ncbi:hypothetical protein [Roseimaritima ulvae]|uniref:Uncharacterized protein n=1 Tax=Roseimaritima ulvae TaxID=980254 RepID=A0A5B9QXQ7_9BACT|nr:hypothetical protein [Roseimaritima ulvae]QEG43844.1 hypothetical protein UC8_59010 [Roseimaritima ulvae]
MSTTIQSLPTRPSWISAIGPFASQNAVSLIVLSMVGIGLIGAYDFYLTIITANFLPEMEQNEIGRQIMGLDDDIIRSQRIALFLALKFAGTVLVLSVLGWMGMVRDRRGVPVALGVLGFQLYLLFVLTAPSMG